MRLLKQALAVLGTLVVIAAIAALVTPKTAHALVSTLVTVVNTSAQPVPTVESETRFQAALALVSGPVSTAFAGANANTFVVPTMTSSGATVKRLVVNNLSGFCSSFDSSTTFIKAVRLRGVFVPDSVSNGSTTFTHYVPVVGPAYSYVNDATTPFPFTNHQETDVTFGQTTQFAFNPGDTVSLESVAFFSTGSGATDFFCIARVEGSLVP